MTRLGEYLQSRAVNRAEVARKTGISTSRLYQLTVNRRTKMTLKECYLIALSIQADRHEMMDFLCKDYELKEM